MADENLDVQEEQNGGKFAFLPKEMCNQNILFLTNQYMIFP